MVLCFVPDLMICALLYQCVCDDDFAANYSRLLNNVEENFKSVLEGGLINLEKMRHIWRLVQEVHLFQVHTPTQVFSYVI